MRLLTDGTGAITDRYDYDAFGNTISQIGSTPNVYLYSGEQNDPNLGFYYLRARYMLPSSGRFLTSDSDEGHGSDPRTLHKYLYAAGDPINKSDPSGNEFTIQELSISTTIDACLQSIPSINAVTALCTAYSTLSSAGTAAFISQIGILLPLALETEGLRPGFVFVQQNFDPKGSFKKFEARIFLAGTDRVLSLAADTTSGIRLRFNFDLDNIRSNNTSLQAGGNFLLGSYTTCGVDVAKLELTYRITYAPTPAYSVGLEATILGGGKLAYTLFGNTFF